MSPRTQTQLSKIRDESRGKILSAALTLFAKQGFHSTSIAQIAKEAGVSKGLIYNYFDKKEELLKQLVITSVADGENILLEMQAMPDAKSRLRFTIDYAIDYIHENFEQFKLYFSLSLQLSAFPDLQAYIKARHKATVPLFAELFRDLFESQEMAQMESMALAALLDGAGLQYIVLEDMQTLLNLKQYLYQRYNLEEEADDSM